MGVREWVWVYGVDRWVWLVCTVLTSLAGRNIFTVRSKWSPAEMRNLRRLMRAKGETKQDRGRERERERDRNT